MAAKQPERVGQGNARRKGSVEHCRSNPTRPLRGHPPLKGEGEKRFPPHAAFTLAFFGRWATTFSIMRMPAFWPSVMIDSGWNCTAAIGSLLCSNAMTTPSSVSLR